MKWNCIHRLLAWAWFHARRWGDCRFLLQCFVCYSVTCAIHPERTCALVALSCICRDCLHSQMLTLFNLTLTLFHRKLNRCSSIVAFLHEKPLPTNDCSFVVFQTAYLMAVWTPSSFSFFNFSCKSSQGFFCHFYYAISCSHYVFLPQCVAFCLIVWFPFSARNTR